MATYQEFSPRCAHRIWDLTTPWEPLIGTRAWLLDEDPKGGRIILVTLTDPSWIWCGMTAVKTGARHFEPSRKVFLTLQDAVTQKRRWNRYIARRMQEGTWGWTHPCPVRPVILNILHKIARDRAQVG